MKVVVSKVIDNKTIKATSSFCKKHEKYKKYMLVQKNYLVDSSGFDVSEGQKIEISECKPISRLKRFFIIKI